MYNKKELVTMLQNGTTVEDIAKQMTEELNAAKEEADRIAAENKAKEEAAKKTAEKLAKLAARKQEAMAAINSAIGAYLTEFHPDSYLAKRYSEDTKEDRMGAVEQMDKLVEMFEMLKDYKISIETSTDKSKLDSLNNRSIFDRVWTSWF